MGKSFIFVILFLMDSNDDHYRDSIPFIRSIILSVLPFIHSIQPFPVIPFPSLSSIDPPADESKDEGTEKVEEDDSSSSSCASASDDDKKKEGQLVGAEDITSGAVTLETVISYLRAGGSQPFLVWLVILGIGGQTFQIFTELYVAEWSAKNNDAADRDHVNNAYHARVFLGLVLGVVGIVFYRDFSHMEMFVRA